MINLDDLNPGRFITVRDKPHADESGLPFPLQRGKSKLRGAVLEVVSINLPYIMVKLIWHEMSGYSKDGTELRLSLDTNEVDIMYLSSEYVESAKKDCRSQELQIE